MKRFATSLVCAPVFLYLTWLGGWYYFFTILIITFIIQFEIIAMLHKQGYNVKKSMVLLPAVPILLMPLYPVFGWLFFLALLIFTISIETFSLKSQGWERLMTTLMVAVVVPALLSGLLILREFGDNLTGFYIAFTLIVAVWSNDIFSFAGGKLFGKLPLAPNISPNKTIEGFLFGFAGSLIAISLCTMLIPEFPLDWAASLPLSLIVGFLGPAGDLAESKLKRACEIKDSSVLMPGHGGFYDRFDAILFSAPGAAIYIYLLDFFEIIAR